MKTAFVFQGGGSIAATQVGMLRALTEAGVAADLVVGSSAGAINAVRFALEPTAAGIDHLETLWSRVKRRDVFPVTAQDLLPALVGLGGGVASNRALRRLLERELGGTDLSELTLPAYVVATDLASGDPVTLSRGPAVRALLATTALPGVFPPVDIDGRRFVDGGIASVTPVLEAEALGAETSYVLPSIGPSDPESVPRGAGPVALRALSQLLGRASANEVAVARHRVYVLPAPSLGRANPFDFRNTRALIDEGERLVREWLHSHRPQAA
ncbi:patatin-like phospholipase family protein [Gandjariella thermophila]|uniref:Patatin n=1 Tax=Gandjariella thermophila TaxID=1931992 RepID=A0A4D4J1I7_9PSEU|nr:patatin-like phospholipase family protein [Gandjariella thermophila]GDY29020.1 patatin [Gandjariella thermophila]